MTLVLVALSTGCSNVGDNMLAVGGVVKYSDGQPVTGEAATIVFHPVRSAESKLSRPASGTIDPDGSFELMTFKPGDGVYPGEYHVVLKAWSNYRKQRSAVPKKYTNETTTPLSATVNQEETIFEFTVERD